MQDDRGLRITAFFLQELEKIAEEGQETADKSMIKEETVDEVTEIKRIKDPKVTSPGEMFGVQFAKMRDGSAKMNPMYLPVPGYTFNPDLQKFVPDMDRPGWITSGEEMVARAKREGYIQAKKEEAMNKIKDQAAQFSQSPTPAPPTAQPTQQPAPQQAQQQAQQPAQAQAQQGQQAQPQ